MGFSQAEQKILVANTAIDTLIQKGLIFSGMKIGLGTGSTVMSNKGRMLFQDVQCLLQFHFQKM